MKQFLENYDLHLPKRFTWRSITKISGPALLLVTSFVLLSACTDALVYSERTGFNLGISVNDEATTPVKLNAGLERNVVTFAPPSGEYKESKKRTIKHDAVSMLSGFHLTDGHGGINNPLGGTLSIRSQFASGEAAVVIARNPAAAARITGVKVAHCKDDNSVRLGDWIMIGGNVKKLQAWKKRNNVPGAGLLPLLRGCGFEILRAKAVADNL